MCIVIKSRCESTLVCNRSYPAVLIIGIGFLLTQCIGLFCYTIVFIVDCLCNIAHRVCYRCHIIILVISIAGLSSTRFGDLSNISCRVVSISSYLTKRISCRSHLACQVITVGIAPSKWICLLHQIAILIIRKAGCSIQCIGRRLHVMELIVSISSGTL